jgi:Flp pilus assembly protein TadB
VTSSSQPDNTRSWETLTRLGGGVLVVWLTVLAAVCEAFLVPLRMAGVRIPVALLLAVAGNLTLPWLARWLSRSRMMTMLPALLWFLVILVLAGGTTEGDVVLAGNDWVALTLLLFGSVAAAAGAYFALLGREPRQAVRSGG